MSTVARRNPATIRKDTSKRRAAGKVPRRTDSLRYIESSALVAALLEHEPGVLAALRVAGRLITSALTLAEASRAILRARVTGRLTAEQEAAALTGLQTFQRRCAIVAVTEAVLTRAGRRFPVEPIRTLDAVHLATVEMLGEVPPLMTIVTRDERVCDNARAMGYALV